ncbi:hypothetical protein [Synoicihabitans lomoniglobus]|uniref:Uncharacterized protein n=1 Tax=Synoicihabitans lomoniglobus TaxID=2909285 RepID=A0AAE9ZTK1_9BACT|nr:hypothetical protein [Opitutaceae bacterium LMO-M01]WED64920.1 hypothetical protein PXH66_21445 [Opitutaceae bacterium LMO-M01]
MNDETNSGGDGSDHSDDPQMGATLTTLTKIYNWVENTHLMPTRLIAWTAFVSMVAALYFFSPVLSLFVLLFCITRVNRAGVAIEVLGTQLFKKTWVSILWVVMPFTYALYFLVVMKPFEVDLASINLRPQNPEVADYVNCMAGFLVGLVVMVRYRRVRSRIDRVLVQE